MAWKRIVKTSTKELAYREKHFHDVRVITDKQIACTACGNQLSVETKQIFPHPSIGVLLCEACLENIEATFHGIETKKHCLICSDNRRLYVCCNKDCFSAFCKGCIKRNFSSSLLDAEEDSWECFSCNPKPLWTLRAICAAVMDSLPKKGKKTSTKIQKRILPSQLQQIEKTKTVQKKLQMLCDTEDENSSAKSLVPSRFSRKVDNKSRTNCVTGLVQQKTVDRTDSSSENSPVSYKRDKRSKSKKQRTKSTRESIDRFEQKSSRSLVEKKDTSKRCKIYSDSNDSSDSSLQVVTEKCTNRYKSEKLEKRKTNRADSSDSENHESDTRRASSTSKRTPKNTKQQNKKIDDSYNAKLKDRARKRHDSTSESESEGNKSRDRGKHAEMSRTTSHGNNDERKRDKSSKSRLPNIQEDDSDNSSSKEFQTIKFQKVNRNKYSTRQLADLETDYTKSPSVKNSANKHEKHIDELKDIKKIVRDCKMICSNFQMHVEAIEQLYGKKDEEQLILKCQEKVEKLSTMVEEKRKNLRTCYHLWSGNRKRSAKKKYKVNSSSDDEQSPAECEKRTVDNGKRISEAEQNEKKTVSECDSDEIFSGSETRLSRKLQTTRRKASGTEDSRNDKKSNTDDEAGMSIDEDSTLKDKDKNDVDTRDNFTTSPVLGTAKEKKTSTEQSSKKQLEECNKSNNGTLMDNNSDANDEQTDLNIDVCNDETEIESSPSRENGCEKRAVKLDGIGQSNKDIINESTDMFDTSIEEAKGSSKEVAKETNCDKGERSHASEDEFLDCHENFSQDEVPSEKKKTSLLSRDIEEENDLPDQDDQEKMRTSVSNKEIHDKSKASEKINTDDNESIDDAEELAKKALLATDSDMSGKINTDNESLDDAEALAKKGLLATDSDMSDTLPESSITEPTKDLIVNNTNRIEEKNEMRANSDVNSDSNTVMLPYFLKMNTDAVKDTTIKAKTQVERENDNRLDKKSRKELRSSDEDAKAEEAAKEALLESNSDDSLLLSSESDGLVDKESISNSSEKNAKAKLSLLASTSSETSSSELVLLDTANVSKSTKRSHEPENDRESLSLSARLKKRRLRDCLDKNYHYNNDKKLRMSCAVHVKRLNIKVLKRHSRALEKSREYLEHKAFKRYREFSVKPMSIILHHLT